MTQQVSIWVTMHSKMLAYFESGHASNLVTIVKQIKSNEIAFIKAFVYLFRVEMYILVHTIY